MTSISVSRDTCDAKHGEVVRAVEEVKELVGSVLLILNGNGKPGLRETQAELSAQIAGCKQRHAEIRQAEAEAATRNENRIMVLIKLLGPYVLPALFFGILYMNKVI